MCILRWRITHSFVLFLHFQFLITLIGIILSRKSSYFLNIFFIYCFVSVVRIIQLLSKYLLRKYNIINRYCIKNPDVFTISELLLWKIRLLISTNPSLLYSSTANISKSKPKFIIQNLPKILSFFNEKKRDKVDLPLWNKKQIKIPFSKNFIVCS